MRIPYSIFPIHHSLWVVLFLLQVGILFAQPQNGLHFDGANDYIQTTYSGISGNNPRTVEAWIKTPLVSGQEIITDWGTQAQGQRFTFNLINGNLRTEINGSGLTGTTLVGDNTWHHVAVTYDNTTNPNYTMYVDGALEASFNLPTTQNTGNSVNFRMGLRVDGANSFSGVMDEVRVWDYARSQAQISADKDTVFCTAPSGLVAYHRLNRGTAGGNNAGANVSYDASPGGNNGTLTGFALNGSTSNWVTGTAISGGPTSFTFADTACSSYTSPSGNHVWTLSGNYRDTVMNTAGCDSFLTVQLTLNSTTGLMTTSACDSYTAPSGTQTWTQSGLYTDTLTNAVGCDSLLTIDLTISNTSSATLSDTSCSIYTSPSGNYMWTTSGTYQDTLSNQAGCDSLLTINLTIPTIDTTVTNGGGILSATTVNATYQWLDCDNGWAPIAGETNQTFTPTVTGNYAVVIDQFGCADTSGCHSVMVTGLAPLHSPFPVSVYPNPTQGSFTLNLGEEVQIVEIELFNAMGQLLSSETFIHQNTLKLSLPESKGIYFLRVKRGVESTTLRMIKA